MRKRAHGDPRESPGTPGVSRRTVTRGMAWTAPVVLTSVTAPAYAASVLCDEGAAVLTNPGSSTVVTALSFVCATATVTYSSQPWIDETPGETGQVRLTQFPAGSIPLSGQWPYVKLHLPEGDTDDTVTMTITFDRLVPNPTLTITGIDRQVGSWIDEVIVDTPGFAVVSNGEFVIGAGTADDPFQSNHEGAISTPQGDLVLTWPGTRAQVAITYRAGDEINDSEPGQSIGVGWFGFLCDSC